ncbi:hypothetical protein BDR03DRAFT_1056758, partial [Suillus americanus]
SFLLFCDQKHIPPEFRCPASEALLCAFAPQCSMDGRVSSRALRLNGVFNLAPSSSSHPQWPLVTRLMLLVLASHLDLSRSCCMLLGYLLFCRHVGSTLFGRDTFVLPRSSHCLQ